MQNGKFLRSNVRKVSKTGLAIVLCLIIFVTSTGAGAISAADTPSSWAVEQVNAAIEEGLVPPNLRENYTQAITRQGFTSLAVALYEHIKGEITGRTKFSDTNDVNVEKAAFVGIVNGVGNNMFAPDTELTREQAAAMLVRLAEALDKPLPKEESTFSDNAQISEWARESVGCVQAGGIMSGVGDNIFLPKGAYTREQSIITIMRLLDMVNSEILTEEPEVPAEEAVVLTEESVYNAIMAMQSEFPNGRKWTDDDTYNGYGGCWAFAMILSDAAFGNLPKRTLQDLDELRIGDILINSGKTHVSIVTKVDGDDIIVAEGNTGGVISWGLWTSLAFIKRIGYTAQTRWPK